MKNARPPEKHDASNVKILRVTTRGHLPLFNLLKHRDEHKTAPGFPL